MKSKRERLFRESVSSEVLDVVCYPNGKGGTLCRFSRYFSADGNRWVRHGRFVQYHDNGRVATEGDYQDGLEVDVWQDYHPNGQLAAEGMYGSGKEIGYWWFWNENGERVAEVEYEDGVEVSRWVAPSADPAAVIGKAAND